MQKNRNDEKERWGAGRLLVLGAALVFFAGCAGLFMDMRNQAPMLRVLHLSGGDAPIGSMLSVYQDRVVLEVLGGRKERRAITKSRANAIEQLLQSPSLTSVRTAKDRSPHEEEIWLELGDSEVGFEKARAPEAVLPLLRELEDLLDAKFPSRVFSLVPGKSVQLFP